MEHSQPSGLNSGKICAFCCQRSTLCFQSGSGTRFKRRDTTLRKNYAKATDDNYNLSQKMIFLITIKQLLLGKWLDFYYLQSILTCETSRRLDNCNEIWIILLPYLRDYIKFNHSDLFSIVDFGNMLLIIINNDWKLLFCEYLDLYESLYVHII
jgi:hypothetical protein